MLIITENNLVAAIEKPLKKIKAAKKLKTKCCKKYEKDNRCKRCPCFDLMQKAS